jgi:hypothetical protein
MKLIKSENGDQERSLSALKGELKGRLAFKMAVQWDNVIGKPNDYNNLEQAYTKYGPGQMCHTKA